MGAYCIFDIRQIHDPDAMERYREQVPPTVAAHGGEYVAIGGPWQIVEGGWHPTFPVIIRFPSMDAANGWYASPEYRDLLALRRAATDGDAVFVEALA